MVAAKDLHSWAHFHADVVNSPSNHFVIAAHFPLHIFNTDNGDRGEARDSCRIVRIVLRASDNQNAAGFLLNL